MRNVNLAHGSLYLLGGYLGYEISEATGLLAARLSGGVRRRRGPRPVLQHQVFRRMEGRNCARRW
jgi:branched-chain amino acid transport system permease protein